MGWLKNFGLLATLACLFVVVGGATPASAMDTTPPSVVISGVPATTNATFTATFTFSEDGTGFSVSDISVGNGAAVFLEVVAPSTLPILLRRLKVLLL